MKALILSDSHGNTGYVLEALEIERDAEMVFFLGDGLNDIELAQEALPTLRQKLRCVRGNCDIGATEPSRGFASLGGLPLMYTHGHLYAVKRGLFELQHEALAARIHIVLYGHTHRPALEQRDGVWLFNPGALSGTAPTYGVCNVEHGEPHFEHKVL